VLSRLCTQQKVKRELASGINRSGESRHGTEKEYYSSLPSAAPYEEQICKSNCS